MPEGPTTDPQDELFDVLDPQGRPTGRVKRRGAVHRDGDWHAAIHVWIVTAGGGEPLVVLQRRSATKDTWPGHLDVSVGGHVRSGETLEQTIRECEEELGLRVEPDELRRIGRRVAATVRGAVRDSEVQDVFGVVVETPLTAFELHPEEVDAVVGLSLPAARQLLVERRMVVAAERRRDERVARPVQILPGEVVPDGDGYYASALDALEPLVAGLDPAPFTIGR